MHEVLLHFHQEPTGVGLRRLGTGVRSALECLLQQALRLFLEVVELEVIYDPDEVANVRLLAALEDVVVSLKQLRLEVVWRELGHVDNAN